MIQFLVLAPLIGAIVSGFFYKLFGEKNVIVFSTLITLIGAFFSWLIFLNILEISNETTLLFNWISSDSFSADWSLKADTLVKVMLVVILSVSALVHLYSIGYMRHDHNWGDADTYQPRFFAYLSFFTFAMLVLVSADNLLQLFFGWEGVGVASYLLIGFYYKKPSANVAAIKAFVVNRVGDFGFLIGIFLIFFTVGSIKFDNIFEFFQNNEVTTATYTYFNLTVLDAICFFLFVGAMGKSAQIFLHTWLPDAMEGPTPVSALIHAATMVTAGVFLCCRFSALYEYSSNISNLILIVGSVTALFASTIALVQNDIKRIIAYSTCSQLGYMFAAIGAGFYQAAMFHLFTHAFFKALLFLGAGSVIHSMHHEQDIRYFGGLRKKLPITFFTMLIGTVAITGVGIPLSYDMFNVNVGFSGFVSKDIIIEGVFASKKSFSYYGFLLLVLSALLTSFYSWRLIFLTFFGSYRGNLKYYDHCREPELSMIIPLIFLALGAIFLGSIFESSFANEKYQIFSDSIFFATTNHVIHDFHYVPKLVKLSPFLVMVIGFSFAYYFYLINREAPKKLALQQPILYRLFLNKWYFDELYERIFVRPLKSLGLYFWHLGDIFLINGSIHGLALKIIPSVVTFASRFQSGFVYHYALIMIIGFTLIMSFFVLSFYGF